MVRKERVPLSSRATSKGSLPGAQGRTEPRLLRAMSFCWDERGGMVNHPTPHPIQWLRLSARTATRIHSEAVASVFPSHLCFSLCSFLAPARPLPVYEGGRPVSAILLHTGGIIFFSRRLPSITMRLPTHRTCHATRGTPLPATS